MSWNYRVLRHDGVDGPYYQVQEVYFEEGDAVPHSWSAGPASVGGENLDEMRTVLDRMAAALDKPVLAIEEDGAGKRLVEVAGGSHASGEAKSHTADEILKVDKTSLWDEFLTTSGRIVAYLDVVLEVNDLEYLKEALANIARAKGLKAVFEDASPQHDQRNDGGE